MSGTVEFVRIQPRFDQPPQGQARSMPAEGFAPVEEMIDKAKARLAAQRNEAFTLPTDPRVTQWKKFNFTRYEYLLSFFKLSSMLAEARDQHPAATQNVLRYIEKCENELGALEIDIHRRTVRPGSALAKAQRIIEGCAEYKDTLDSWRGHLNRLLIADKTIRENLFLAALLPIARELSKKNAELVEDGFIFYSMVKDDEQANGHKTLHELKAQAIDLEKRIRTVDLGGLSGLARTIVDHQLQVVLRTTDQVKSFIEYFLQNLPGEILSVDRIQQELTGLKQAPAPAILEKLDALIPTLARNLIDLRHKAKTLKQIRLLPLILDEIKNLQLSLKTTILPELQRRIKETGSSVNPNSLAAEKTAEFFMGLKGFVRAVKLLFSSLGGQKVVKVDDLHKKIVDILTSCEVYYGSEREELGRLQNFIDAKLSDFDRPFPYEGIYQIVKESIAAYGTRLEKLLFSFEVTDYTNEDAEESAAHTEKSTLGRLIAKLEVRSANLESAKG
ncbi:hypothetical protein ACUUL3_02630 [Thiovibrio sp. JS02]